MSDEGARRRLRRVRALRPAAGRARPPITGGAELTASRGRTVHPTRHRHRGPVAESAEQVGGFYQVETDDLDDLLDCCLILAATGDAVRWSDAAPPRSGVVKYLVLLHRRRRGEAVARADRRGDGRRHGQVRRVRQGLRRPRDGVELLAGEALGDSGTTPPLRTTRRQVALTDGPYAEVIEGMGGFYLLEAPDLDVVTELLRRSCRPTTSRSTRPST